MRLIVCTTLALALATPALAGPAGHGLTHTEWVAAKARAAKAEPLRLRAPADACVPHAEAALNAEAAVHSVARSGGDLLVRLKDAKASPEALQQVVDTACDKVASAS